MLFDIKLAYVSRIKLMSPDLHRFGSSGKSLCECGGESPVESGFRFRLSSLGVDGVESLHFSLSSLLAFVSALLVTVLLFDDPSMSSFFNLFLALKADLLLTVPVVF